jgi:hypothetical protein
MENACVKALRTRTRPHVLGRDDEFGSLSLNVGHVSIFQCAPLATHDFLRVLIDGLVHFRVWRQLRLPRAFGLLLHSALRLGVILHLESGLVSVNAICFVKLV